MTSRQPAPAAVAADLPVEHADSRSRATRGGGGTRRARAKLPATGLRLCAPTHRQPRRRARCRPGRHGAVLPLARAIRPHPPGPPVAAPDRPQSGPGSCPPQPDSENRVPRTGKRRRLAVRAAGREPRPRSSCSAPATSEVGLGMPPGAAPRYRETLVLRDYHDLAYAEIASTLKIPRGTVMSRLHRARRLLHDLVHSRHRSTGEVRDD